jgi:hypothetical protein
VPFSGTLAGGIMYGEHVKGYDDVVSVVTVVSRRVHYTSFHVTE